jgi:hypothetical protein
MLYALALLLLLHSAFLTLLPHLSVHLPELVLVLVLVPILLVSHT